jgi:hypothetical protein
VKTLALILAVAASLSAQELDPAKLLQPPTDTSTRKTSAR